MAASLARESHPITEEAPLEEKIHPKISVLPGTIQQTFHACWAMLHASQTHPTSKTCEEIILVHGMVRLHFVLASRLQDT